MDQMSEVPKTGVCQSVVRLAPGTAPLLAALSQLSELAKALPEVVQGFLDGLLDLSELVRVNRDGGTAGPAGELRILFEPSDLLRDFLAATRAGNVDGVAV